MEELIRRSEAVKALDEQYTWHDLTDPDAYARILGKVETVDAVEVVRCKECRHRYEEECPMHYIEWYTIDEGDGYVDDDYRVHDWTTDEGYCDRGDRKDGEV